MGLVIFAVLLPYLLAAYKLQRKMQKSGAMGVTSPSKISGLWWGFLLPACAWGLIAYVCIYKYSKARHNHRVKGRQWMLAIACPTESDR